MRKAEYFAYVQKALEYGRDTMDESIERWKAQYAPDSFLGMYSGPGAIPPQIFLEGFMYKQTGDMDYARRAKALLLSMQGYTELMPPQIAERHPEFQNAIPPFIMLFQDTFCCYGYLNIVNSGVFTQDEKEAVLSSIRLFLKAARHFPEWGAHNRAVLRAWTLSLCMKILEGEAEGDFAKKLYEYVMADNVGGWSIEDAQSYLPFWLISLVGAAGAGWPGDKWYDLPQTRYYFEWYLRVLAPTGQIPDYGDANFDTNWYLWGVLLEKGAARYQSPEMKWGAQQVMAFAEEKFGFKEQISPSWACFFAMAHDWMDDELEPARPDYPSGPVMEDVIGKKIAFRTGWEPEATYLLMSYKDEGDGGFMARENLRQTLCVPAEKAHHGHSDENSIIFLEKDDNVLLHDGGYRDMAPNGRYRDDLYHNRLCFREGEMKADQSCFDFLHGDGHYKKAQTKQLFFHRFDGLEYSRTRMADEDTGTLWDRNIVFLPEEDVFILVDWTVAGAKTGTQANLLHTKKVLSKGDAWVDVQVDHIYKGMNDAKPVKNKDRYSLLVEYLTAEGRNIGQEEIRRNYGESLMLYEAQSSVKTAGERSVFVTVLSVKEAKATPATGRIRVAGISAEKDSLSLLCDTARGKLTLCLKLDLDKGLDKAIYPAYTWARGAIDYGRVHTDADFAFIRDEKGGMAYGFLNGITVEADGRELMKPELRSNYLFHTGVFEPVKTKWKGWDGFVPSGKEV